MIRDKSTRYRCEQIKGWGFGRIVKYADGDRAIANRIYTKCRDFLTNGDDPAGTIAECSYAYDLRNSYEREQRRRNRESSSSELMDTMPCSQVQEEYGNHSNQLNQLLHESAEIFATPGQARILRVSEQLGEKATKRLAGYNRARSGGSSIANVAKKRQRASIHALAGLPFVVSQKRSDDFPLLVSTEFAKLLPYCPRVLMCFDSHVQDVRLHAKQKGFSDERLEDGFSRLWEYADGTMRDVFNEPNNRHENHKLGLAALIMLMTSRFLASRHASQFQSTLNCWKRAGLLKDAQMRRQLASIGAFCGQSQYQMDFLREEASSEVELAAAALFMAGRRCPTSGMSLLVRNKSCKVLEFVDSVYPQAFGDILCYADSFIQKKRYTSVGSAIMMMRWVQSSLRYKQHIKINQLIKSFKTLDYYGTEIKGESELKKEFDRTWKMLRDALGDHLNKQY